MVVIDPAEANEAPAAKTAAQAIYFIFSSKFQKIGKAYTLYNSKFAEKPAFKQVNLPVC
jgi:hypothetical protein